MFDARKYGLLLTGLRYQRGIRSGEVFAERVSELLGRTFNKRTLYRIENGEQIARADEQAAFAALLSPPPGYFESALEATDD